MDSESMAAAVSASVPQSKENGSGGSLSHSETPAVVDDDRGTASESEDSNEEISMPAFENGGNRKLGLSEIPNLVGVKDERVEGVEVWSGGSNLEEEGESKTDGSVNGIEGNGLGFAENEKNGKNLVSDTNSKPVVVEVGTENNLAVDDTKSKPVEVEDALGEEFLKGIRAIRPITHKKKNNEGDKRAWSHNKTHGFCGLN